ncbi:NAD(P)-binding protein [Karstenula rhodostoma CBS 690.94]|uniref:NAD(P)-binding protein n=1 Tax=Karstenula rhodostoma CBS 690.94 TaxID=1392251 RepID=A0A9P4PWZ1_9PLEO|nr:NAD(P)-binding protein [Karstenula rhodostoma CBS 690.94]
MSLKNMNVLVMGAGIGIGAAITRRLAQEGANLILLLTHRAQAESGPIDALINNAGLALGAPAAFSDLKIRGVVTMTGTNINGYMLATYAVLNDGGMRERGKGTLLKVTSTTALDDPPFPGESIYHATRRFQEGFTDALRT